MKALTLALAIVLAASIAPAQTLPQNRHVVPQLFAAGEECSSATCIATRIPAVPKAGITVVYADMVLIPPVPSGYSYSVQEFDSSALTRHALSCYPYTYYTPAFLDFFNSLGGHMSKGYVFYPSEGKTYVWWVDIL